MSGSFFLLSVVLSGISVPGTTLRATGPSWVTATALAARVQEERGAIAHPAVGYRHGTPLVLAVVDVAGDGVETQVEVETALAYYRMAEAARQQGVTVSVISGFRSQEKQRELYRDYRRGRGHLASKPGHSNHQSGHALDLDTTQPGVKLWLKRNAWKFGFKRTVPSERWHWEHW